MSEELSKVEPTQVFIKVNGEEREIKFTFSAWAQISKKYGGIQNLSKLQKDMENNPFEVLPELIYIALVNKENVTKETVLDDYSMADIEEISEKLATALMGSLPTENDKKKSTKMKK